jgi:L,D-peptidoglycan transpeptidase YkuD (ErfK/YbiS/YcfS/YnhG family)
VPRRRHRHAAALSATVTLIASCVLAGSSERAVASPPPYHPSRLTHLGDARQVIVVTAPSWSATHATLRSYGKGADGAWRLQQAAVPARLGYKGFAPIGDRHQDSLQTPAGTFRLPRAFGARPDPGARLGYRQFDRNDWWPYDPRDPRTYNVYQLGRPTAARWRPSWAEHLWEFRDQYAFAVVLDYNLPKGIYRSGGQRFARETPDTGAGGGIFLHVSAAHPTAGCVSVPLPAMRRIVRWLDPAAHPRIVMAPTSAIGRA